MEFQATPLTGPEQIRAAAAATRYEQRGGTMPLRQFYRSEHSPIRAEVWWLELLEIPAYVSVHLVRHKIGAEHYVQSHREDAAPVDPREVHRLTPVNHRICTNSQAVLNMSRARLCFKADKRTRQAWRLMVQAVGEHRPELARYAVPECCYRGGICPEPKQCRVGKQTVLGLYGMPHAEDE